MHLQDSNSTNLKLSSACFVNEKIKKIVAIYFSPIIQTCVVVATISSVPLKFSKTSVTSKLKSANVNNSERLCSKPGGHWHKMFVFLEHSKYVFVCVCVV